MTQTSFKKLLSLSCGLILSTGAHLFVSEFTFEADFSGPDGSHPRDG